MIARLDTRVVGVAVRRGKGTIVGSAVGDGTGASMVGDGGIGVSGSSSGAHALPSNAKARTTARNI